MKRHVSIGSVALLLLLALPCVGSAYGQRRSRIVERHPTPENIPEVTDPRFILHEKPSLTFLEEDKYERIAIGVAEGEHYEMFGSVADVAAVGDGTFLVLDSEGSEVRIFDFEGTHLGTIGKPGEGPGEFYRPPDYVSVADQGSSVFTVGFFSRLIMGFVRENVARFAPEYRFPKGLSGEAGCAMNGHFWFFGYSPGVEGVLHKFTYEGERVASFLEWYKSPRDYISRMMSRHGQIACSEQHGIVALNRVNAPVITGYRENGEMAWQVALADFDPLQYVEYSNPGWGWDRPKKGKAQLRSFFTDSSGDFYVQYSVAEGDGFQSIPDHGHLFRIEGDSGEGTYLGIGPPVRDIDFGGVISASNNPFPHVVIHKPK